VYVSDVTIENLERSGRTRLGRALLDAGAMAEDWAPTFAAVDRAAFLPLRTGMPGTPPWTGMRRS
jgi:hypothetical protein